MRYARMRTTCLLTLAILTIAAGCQRPATLYTVNGKVTYKGAVLNNGVVVFTPDTSRGESGSVAIGSIRQDGNYTLSTGEASGATPGWYRVSVAAFTAPAPKSQAADFQSPTPLLPEKYRDPELSMLRCKVQANQVNMINLELD